MAACHARHEPAGPAPSKSPPPRPRRELTAAEKNLEGLCLAKWAEQLAGLDPKEYAEPPPGRPSLVLSRKARVLLYERRAGQKRALFHPGDLLARTPEAEQARDGLGAEMTR